MFTTDVVTDGTTAFHSRNFYTYTPAENYAGMQVGTTAIAGNATSAEGMANPFWRSFANYTPLGNTLRLTGGVSGTTYFVETQFDPFLIGGLITEGEGTTELGRKSGNCVFTIQSQGLHAANLTINTDTKLYGNTSYNVKSSGTWTIASGKTLTFGSSTTTTFDSNVNVVLNGNVSFTGGVTLSEGSSLTLKKNNTYSMKLSGSGTVIFDDFAKCPTNVTFSDSWTGTVIINSISAPGQVDLNNMGNANSSIKLMGITGNSYIATSDVTINPTVIIAGDVVFNNGSSGKTYTFKKIVGTSENKNLSLVGWNTCTGVTYKINELSSFGGTLSSTGTSITTTVDKLVLSETPTVGTKVLSTSGNPTVSSVYVGETAMSSDLFTMKDDGLYYNKVARTTVANGYGTICLPYDATSTGVILMECAGKSADGNGIVFNYVDGTGVNANLEAGKPYLYRATATTQTFTTTGTEYKDATSDGYNFIGTYTAQTLTNGEYFLYSKTLNNGGDDMFHPAGDYVNIGAYKCYFTSLPTEEARANTNSCVFGIFGDEATGIQSINTSVDLNKEGKFINNGRVVIVKNGKKFNVAGQAVK